MEKIQEFIGNNYIAVFSTIGFVVILLLSACTSSWKTVVKQPTSNPLVITEFLYTSLESKLENLPDSKIVLKKIITEIKSKLSLVDDGQITIDDAFTDILVVTPTDYKPAVILLKLTFNTVYGDYGKEIPADHKARIKTINQIIKLLEKKINK